LGVSNIDVGIPHRDEGADSASPERRHRRLRTVVTRMLIGAFVILVLAQLVPYGWRHSNPPVIADAPWPDADSAEVARSSCYSCHSNETDWPFYSYVAPMSWLVRSDVDRGREAFNFSDWDEYGSDADDAVEMIEDGEMPPGRFTMIHGDARLSDAERQLLIAALEQMSDGEKEGGGDDSGRGSND
jgi:hypothetical protein